MSWVKIDDSFPDHPKALQAGPEGIALWLQALCYSNKHLTDGQLPVYVVRSMRSLVGQPLKIADRLVSAGLWERTSGGYQIHDYHEHYPSAADVKARRAQDAARKRDGVPREVPPESSQNPLGIRPESSRNPGVRAHACAGSDQDLSSDEALSQGKGESEGEPLPAVLAKRWPEEHRQATGVLGRVRPAHDAPAFCELATRYGTAEEVFRRARMMWAAPKLSHLTRNPKLLIELAPELDRHLLEHGEDVLYGEPPRPPIGASRNTAGNVEALRRFVARHKTGGAA